MTDRPASPAELGAGDRTTPAIAGAGKAVDDIDRERLLALSTNCQEAFDLLRREAHALGLVAFVAYQVKGDDACLYFGVAASQ